MHIALLVLPGGSLEDNGARRPFRPEEVLLEGDEGEVRDSRAVDLDDDVVEPDLARESRGHPGDDLDDVVDRGGHVRALQEQSQPADAGHALHDLRSCVRVPEDRGSAVGVGMLVVPRHRFLRGRQRSERGRGSLKVPREERAAARRLPRGLHGRRGAPRGLRGLNARHADRGHGGRCRGRRGMRQRRGALIYGRRGAHGRRGGDLGVLKRDYAVRGLNDGHRARRRRGLAVHRRLDRRVRRGRLGEG
mmetsp:Transcript_69392/g.159177  ORF Transcript_69392/g.159177 Transcript_69392/m.159177 type:complete len:248 (-) Transcript_69392:858-1601(-)